MASLKDRRPPEDYVRFMGHNADGTIRIVVDLALFADYDKEEALDAIIKVGQKLQGEKHGVTD